MAAGFLLVPVATLPKLCGGSSLSGPPFTLGLASGDPRPDGVVLWTRLAPEPLNASGGGGMPQVEVPVRWEIAHDEGFQRIARRGTASAAPDLAHSVHAEVEGLEPARWYYYRFKAGEEISPTGRTKTAPAPGSGDSGLSFAYASCQDWQDGHYPSYGGMVREDLDFVVHLGDYIYERKDTRTLEDFRNLHALYKSAPELREAHASFPFIAVFDDHEVDNDWAGETSEKDEPSDEFLKLREAALQAYYEHMPLRPSAMPRGPRMRIHRRHAFGELAEFNVLDTRQHRTDQADGRLIALRQPASRDETRTMTGSRQEKWLFDGLARSEKRWNVIAQQTMMARYDYQPGEGERINHDQWDGYTAARDRLLDFVGRSRPSNPLVISGDWHASFVNDLKADFDNPDSETLAAEFVGTSISSGCPWAGQVQAALSENPHVRFFDGDHRGYVRCTVDKRLWRTDYRIVENPEAPATTLTSWMVEDGHPGAQPA
ncbi:alkaline phosphatase D family protein [Rubrobacter aplysinae]|uniref:alkaline phosphatase D family protein n=1 Tax=Rubrobacter aplysinae TaxID=909625 RepID=UPI000A8876A1|nr:alkaline phosphatase D family protein [Rubrobacter aplysinae]